MLVIQCTKKLKDELKIEFSDKELYNIDPLYSWHSHFFKFGRMKCTVVMNTLTRYNFILVGLKNKDFQDYERIVIGSIRENLLLDGATDEMVEKYFDKIKQIIYLPTNSRPVIGQMNEVITTFTWWIENKSVEEVNRKLNNHPMLTLPKIYSGIAMLDELNNL